MSKKQAKSSPSILIGLIHLLLELPVALFIIVAVIGLMRGGLH